MAISTAGGAASLQGPGGMSGFVNPITGPDGRFIDLPTTQPIQTPWGGMQDIEPVWADSFDWNTATLADAHRKLSTDKYGMVNYAKYSDADAQRLLDSERSSMASTQQPAPQATGGMGAINPSVFPAIANGMFGGNGTTTQGTGGKGVGNIVPAQPQAVGQNFFPQPTIYQSPVTVDSAQSLIQLANTPQGPYKYGDLGLTTSDYSIWGSKGNPYMTGGLGYNPGTRWGTPIVPVDVVTTPPSSGGNDDFPTTTTPGDNGGFWGEDSQGWGDLTYGDKAALGLFAPGLPLLGSLAYGRLDAPGGGYARLPWYEGSAGGGYGYTAEGYDEYAPGDSDRGIYDASTGERAWGDEFDDYNTGDLWAETSWYEGIGNLIGGRTWDGLEAETYGDPNSKLAKEATQLQLAEKAEKAANRQALADAEQAKLDAEQARWDAQYAQINDLNTQQVGLMNDIKSDMQSQYGTFQDEILSQVAAENASMFDSFAEYKQWMGDSFTTLESGLDEALAQQAAISEGLNANQIDLMNQIAQDMNAQYGDFTGSVSGQLEQMAAENASMFDSLEEYQEWMGDSFTNGGSSDEAGSASDSNMADAGFSQEDQDFIDSGFDSGWGDSSDAGDGTTDASDDPGGDDDDAGGWSFSDDDSGGGWGDWGDDDGGFE